MPLATTFLDALSRFALIALGALASGAALWLAFDLGTKFRTLSRVRTGLKELARVKSHCDTWQVSLEVFLLGVFRIEERITEERVRHAIQQLPEAQADASVAEVWTKDALSLEARLMPFLGAVPSMPDVLVQIKRARGDLGTAPVAAIEHELARSEEGTSPFAGAREVAAFLRSCDWAERLVDAALPVTVFNSRSVEPSEPGAPTGPAAEPGGQ